MHEIFVVDLLFWTIWNKGQNKLLTVWFDHFQFVHTAQSRQSCHSSSGCHRYCSVPVWTFASLELSSSIWAQRKIVAERGTALSLQESSQAPRRSSTCCVGNFSPVFWSQQNLENEKWIYFKKEKLLLQLSISNLSDISPRNIKILA